MRLWQKIFLLTLCLTVLAADSVSLLLLTQSHADSLSLARERIRTISDGAIQELGHLIQERREELGSPMLTESEMEALASRIRLDVNGRLFLADSAESAADAQENEIHIEPLIPASAGQLPPEAESAVTELVEEEGEIRIRRSTTAFWEGRFYRVEVSSDLSELFGRFRRGPGPVQGHRGSPPCYGTPARRCGRGSCRIHSRRGIIALPFRTGNGPTGPCCRSSVRAIV